MKSSMHGSCKQIVVNHEQSTITKTQYFSHIDPNIKFE